MNELSKQLYRKVFAIRSMEERIQQDYSSDQMKTPVHLSLGEEAIVAGVTQAMRHDDKVFGTYRSHALFIAKGGNWDHFYGEMYGRNTGIAKGKAGSMHLSSPEHGFIASSAVVSSIIPVALGAAHAIKASGSDNIAAVFFGDGATEEGVFWETLNFACLKKLPILFVCEDNGLAIHAHRKDRQAYDITKTVATYGLPVTVSDSTDAEDIFMLAQTAIESIRKANGPAFLRLHYHRYLEHVGICEDFVAGYRTRGDCEHWYDKDPVKVMRKKLLDNGVSEEKIVAEERAILDQIDKSVAKASQAPFACEDELFKDIYA